MSDVEKKSETQEAAPKKKPKWNEGNERLVSEGIFSDFALNKKQKIKTNLKPPRERKFCAAVHIPWAASPSVYEIPWKSRDCFQIQRILQYRS